MIVMISPLTTTIAIRFGRRVGGGWGRGSRRSMASMDRRIPSPAFGALRRRRVGGSGVAWDTATLLGSPIIASGRAVCTLGRGRRSLWWSTFRQTTVLRGPPVSRSSEISMVKKASSYSPEFVVLAILRTGRGRKNEWDQGGQNSENNFELHVYKSRRVVGVVRNE